ncbi:MAG: hypothetical protein NC908_02585 [Candidatus Omnitrophica bacterium]|nr:hypothetical protein [Candidatus Omnitrophota bacterium]
MDKMYLKNQTRLIWRLKRTVPVGLTLVEALIALAIFSVVIGLVLIVVTGLFRSTRQIQTLVQKTQRQRLCLWRLSREIASIIPVHLQESFRAQEKEFFFVFAREDKLAESRYVYNPSGHKLERYFQEPTDFDWATSGIKEDCLDGLVDFKFSYSDGNEWYSEWPQTQKQLPCAIKIAFSFVGENREREIIVNVPVSPGRLLKYEKNINSNFYNLAYS